MTSNILSKEMSPMFSFNMNMDSMGDEGNGSSNISSSSSNNDNNSSSDDNNFGAGGAVFAWPSETPFDHPRIRNIFIVLYIVVFVASILGNLLVIFVILRHRRMRTVINCFLANLALSDLLVGVFCVLPNLSSYLSPYWYLGRAMCKLYYTVQNICYTASIIVMTVISLERYVAIIHPMFNRRLTRMWVRKMTSAVVWLVAVICGVPLAIVYDVVMIDDFGPDGQLVHTPFCIRVVQIDMAAYTTINFVLWYAVPLAIMTFVYSRIAHVLWRTTVIINGRGAGGAGIGAGTGSLMATQSTGSVARLHFRANHTVRGATMSAAALKTAAAAATSKAHAVKLAGRQNGHRNMSLHVTCENAAVAQLPLQIENDYKPRGASDGVGCGGGGTTTASSPLVRNCVGPSAPSDPLQATAAVVRSCSQLNTRQQPYRVTLDSSGAMKNTDQDIEQVRCNSCGRELLNDSSSGQNYAAAINSSRSRSSRFGTEISRRRSSDTSTCSITMRQRTCSLPLLCCAPSSRRRRSGSQSDVTAGEAPPSFTNWLLACGNVNCSRSVNGSDVTTCSATTSTSNADNQGRYRVNSSSVSKDHTARRTVSEQDQLHRASTVGSGGRPSSDSVQQMLTTSRRCTASYTDVIQMRRKVVKLLLAVISSFALCSLPYQVYAMWQTWRPHNRNVTSPTISFMELLLPPITFLVLYFNSCLNPIIYALLSENFRKYLRELCCSHLLVLIPGCLRDRFRHRSRHHHQQHHQHMHAMYVFVDGRRLSIGQNTLVSSRS